VFEKLKKQVNEKIEAGYKMEKKVVKESEKKTTEIFEPPKNLEKPATAAK